MPAKYSHVKKRPTTSKKTQSVNGQKYNHHPRMINPHIDKSISQAMTAVSQLERAISRIILLRYEQDIARLFSTRLYSISLVYLPTFVMRCVTLGGPGWMAHNADSEEVKDFLRAMISMDLRQTGERVSTKSVLWSYTALRHFAMSNDITICRKRGLHSLRLLPHYAALKAHLDVLESMPPPTFSKPPHLGSLQDGQDALEDACEMQYNRSNNKVIVPPEWEYDWRIKVRTGYTKVAQTLWRVAKEFDVRGYGKVLREKLTTKWCECGCSTDHLGEVCERPVRQDEEENGVRLGKQREWDGRGYGVYGWETREEEDIWESELDYVGDIREGEDSDMTISEVMDWRFLKAEDEKEKGNDAFRKGEFDLAVKHYEAALDIEPELPYYQLNLAAAHLKLNNWIEAEKACTDALGLHRSVKGYYRRARARKMTGRIDDAIRDLRAVLRLQPSNSEAIAELLSLLPPVGDENEFPPAGSSSTSQSASKQQFPSNADQLPVGLYERLGTAKPKKAKPLPFPATKADERKLKIIPLPASAPSNSIVDELLEAAEHSPIFYSCGHACCAEHKKDKEEQSSKKTEGQNPKLQEMEKLKGSERLTFPGWNRYIVKRIL